jgi:Cu+-exporting ATPase
MSRSKVKIDTVCVHCGDPCPPGSIEQDGNLFCCSGCLTVYTLLSDSNLGSYYKIEERPGLKPTPDEQADQFAYLDDEIVVAKLLDFDDGSTGRIEFHLPQIHCSSCVWLLENLHRLTDGVRESRVDFGRRRATIQFDQSKLSLRQLVETLASIGYEPHISLANLEDTTVDRTARKLYARLAVAGFSFGNIMLFSFPQYLGLDSFSELRYTYLFGILKIILSLPVLLYSATGFFTSAYSALRHRRINMDLPIAIGVIMLFGRSLWEILILTEPGYLDSLCGLVFFLLIGRIYQRKTYQSLSFDNDYKSYFPIAVRRLAGETVKTIPVSALAVGDRLQIRNHEIIPADSILISGDGRIDYSFVTGEADPKEAISGDRLFAGGRQHGASIEMEVVKLPSHSYLLQLWGKQDKEEKALKSLQSLADRVASIFTPVVLALSALAAIVWLSIDSGRALDAATAVLIVACPCALALSTPFALGTVQRILGRNQLFLKDPSVVERLSRIDSIVFDKTGTITMPGNSGIEFVGAKLSAYEHELVVSLAANSTHPLSVQLYESLGPRRSHDVSGFSEQAGRGLTGEVDGKHVRLGSHRFVGGDTDEVTSNETRVYLAIDNHERGYFRLTNIYRPQLADLLKRLRQRFSISLLSGDNDFERETLTELFGEQSELHFKQSPHDKLDYIRSLEKSGKSSVMVGDGLNDAGALRAASVGLAVSEKDAAFSPACDGILRGDRLTDLDQMIAGAKDGMRVVVISFSLSFLYNIIGLYFAFTGQLSPLFAAVLMPASSVTVVLVATLLGWAALRRRGMT